MPRRSCSGGRPKTALIAPRAFKGAGDLKRFEFEPQSPRKLAAFLDRCGSEQRGPPYVAAHSPRGSADLVDPGYGDHGARPVRNRISKVAGIRPSGKANRSA